MALFRIEFLNGMNCTLNIDSLMSSLKTIIGTPEKYKSYRLCSMVSI